MGCCSPEYRKIVEEQEHKVNQIRNNKIPIWGKVVSIAIVVCATILFVLL